MATKKNAVVGIPAQEYDAIPDGTPDVSDALRDQRLKKYHAMMEGQDADVSLLDRTDRKDWPEGEEL
jgi:hypothetical protein